MEHKTQCVVFSLAVVHKIFWDPGRPSLCYNQTKGWKSGKSYFVSRHGQDIYLFSKESRLAVGPNSHPPHWVPRGFSLRVKLDADHSPSSSVEDRLYGALPPLPSLSS